MEQTEQIEQMEQISSNIEKSNETQNKKDNTVVQKENTVVKMKDKILVILGSQWGDESKGKLVDVVSRRFDVCARFNGGANAGHQVYRNGKKYVLHLLPSGIIENFGVGSGSGGGGGGGGGGGSGEGESFVKCVMGNGMVINIPSLFKEIGDLENIGVVGITERLIISDHAHIVCELHKVLDGMRELGVSAIGSTKQGIGPCYTDKAGRIGLRMGDFYDLVLLEKKMRNLAEVYSDKIALYNETIIKNSSKSAIYNDFEGYKRFQYYVNGHWERKYDVEEEIAYFKIVGSKILPMLRNTVSFLHEQLVCGSSILIEGAQAAMLDLDHGSYPFVTSSNPTIGGAFAGLGLGFSPEVVDHMEVCGVVKAYTTRVGSGPFPTELEDAVGARFQDVGKEYGSTTGRKRRCGWLDLMVVAYTHKLNGYHSLNLTKLDVLSGLPTVKVAVAYCKNNVYYYNGDMPYDLDGVDVIYEEFEGWNEDITQCKKYEDLPLACRDYVEFIEEFLRIPIKYIGVGPNSEQMIEHYADEEEVDENADSRVIPIDPITKVMEVGVDILYEIGKFILGLFYLLVILRMMGRLNFEYV